jgi:hypothetical protein
MPGVNAQITVGVNAKQTGSGDLGIPAQLVNFMKEIDFTPGTLTAGQANVMFSDTRTLAASAAEDLDLAGVLSDALGAVITAAEVLAILVYAHTGNTNDLQLTRPAANGVPVFLAAGDGLPIGPGDAFLFTSRKGIAVTPATGDLIHLLNGGGTTGVDYDIIVLGRTVAA